MNTYNILTIVISLIATAGATVALNRLKGMHLTSPKLSLINKFRVPIVYISNGLLAVYLVYITGQWDKFITLYGPRYDVHVPLYVIAFIGASVGYALWRQKGPTLAWLGGMQRWHSLYSLPNHPFINKLLTKCHKLDINSIPKYAPNELLRIGLIGGAYRGFLYLLPMALIMSLMSSIAAMTCLLGLTYGVICAISGVDGPWGEEKGMIERSENISGLIIVWMNYSMPIIASALY